MMMTSFLWYGIKLCSQTTAEIRWESRRERVVRVFAPLSSSLPCPARVEDDNRNCELWISRARVKGDGGHCYDGREDSAPWHMRADGVQQRPALSAVDAAWTRSQLPGQMRLNSLAKRPRTSGQVHQWHPILAADPCPFLELGASREIKHRRTDGSREPLTCLSSVHLVVSRSQHTPPDSVDKHHRRRARPALYLHSANIDRESPPPFV